MSRSRRRELLLRPDFTLPGPPPPLAFPIPPLLQQTGVLTHRWTKQAIQQRQGSGPAPRGVAGRRVGARRDPCQLHLARLHAYRAVSPPLPAFAINPGLPPTVLRPLLKPPQNAKDPRRQPGPEAAVDVPDPAGPDGPPGGPHGPRGVPPVGRVEIRHRRRPEGRRRLHRYVSAAPRLTLT